jgi:hypothetical protein
MERSVAAKAQQEVMRKETKIKRSQLTARATLKIRDRKQLRKKFALAVLF